MNKINYYLIVIEESEFKEIKKFRNIRIEGQAKEEFSNIKSFDQILITVKNEKNIRAIIAEYEIDEIENNGNVLNLKIEPIYIAPFHNGIVLNELVYIRLSHSYKNTKQWEQALENTVVRIHKSDFKKLSTKLII